MKVKKKVKTLDIQDGNDDNIIYIPDRISYQAPGFLGRLGFFMWG